MENEISDQEEELYGYKFTIWGAVSHNGKFSHNVNHCIKVIHAKDAESAFAEMDKNMPKDDVNDYGTGIVKIHYWIFGVKYLGKVSRRLVTVYTGKNKGIEVHR